MAEQKFRLVSSQEGSEAIEIIEYANDGAEILSAEYDSDGIPVVTKHKSNIKRGGREAKKMKVSEEEKEEITQDLLDTFPPPAI